MLTAEEIESRSAVPKEEWGNITRFCPRDRLRLLHTVMGTHRRTPAYTKGKVGRVHVLSGAYPGHEPGPTARAASRSGTST